jgi:hypothetical protein
MCFCEKVGDTRVFQVQRGAHPRTRFLFHHRLASCAQSCTKSVPNESCQSLHPHHGELHRCQRCGHVCGQPLLLCVLREEEHRHQLPSLLVTGVALRAAGQPPPCACLHPLAIGCHGNVNLTQVKLCNVHPCGLRASFGRVCSGVLRTVEL